MSYLRVRSELNTKIKRSEMRIQISDGVAMVLVETIALTLYTLPLEGLYKLHTSVLLCTF